MNVLSITDVHYKSDGTNFIWTRSKAQSNLRKHGVSFVQATTVFSDPYFVLTDATRNTETREAVIGFDSDGKLLFVVHVEIDGESIRIISARKAELNDERIYAQ